MRSAYFALTALNPLSSGASTKKGYAIAKPVMAPDLETHAAVVAIFATPKTQ